MATVQTTVVMRWLLLLSSFFVMSFSPTLEAQEIRTHKGAKIIVYPDGTARYFNTRELVEDFNGSDSTAAFPVIAVKIEPLSSAVSVTEEDLKRIATRRLQLAEEAANLAEQRATAAIDNREKLENRLATAKAINESGMASRLQRQLLLAQKIEQESAEEKQTAEKRLQEAKSILYENRYVSAYNESRKQRKARSAKGAKNAEMIPHARRLFTTQTTSFTGYGKTVNQKASFPQNPCSLAYEGPDENTGQYIRASEPSLFFSHTDESLRPYLAGKEYLSAQAYVHSRGGFRYLTIRLVFANPNAITTYGFIDKGSLLSLHLLDGNYVNLRSVRTANGSWDAEREELSYEVTYAIDRSVISSLKQSDLDYVQLFWSSGFEEYDIYQVDVLQRLLACL
ncbi:MAG: hypothetical protein AAF828_04850 [Bacteroidota bacterium]